MMRRLRDRRRLTEFKAEQRAKRRRRPSSWRGDEAETGAPVQSVRWAGLTWAQTKQAQALLERGRRLQGIHRAAQIGGIKGAVQRGLVGDSAWGRRMRAGRGGRAMARHGSHILRENQPKAVRAAVIARRRRKAATAFDRERDRGVSLSSAAPPTSFLAL